MANTIIPFTILEIATALIFNTAVITDIDVFARKTFLLETRFCRPANFVTREPSSPCTTVLLISIPIYRSLQYFERKWSTPEFFISVQHLNCRLNARSSVGGVPSLRRAYI